MTADARAGRVGAVLRSAGGVPKGPVEGALRVTVEGLEGDWQLDRKHHGGPERALCLFSIERLDALRAEGHEVFPGALGENLCLEGIDWALVKPGTRIRLGSTVQIEITRDAAPCKTIAHCFRDRDFMRVSEKTHPGWSRAYAKVLAPGLVQVGDPAVLERD